jgi:NADH:ubiquinone oxidoreductase subunit 6 (subunit J)
VAAWFYVFPTKNWAYYLFSSLNAFITLVFLWLGLQQIFNKQKVFIAIALTTLVLPFSIEHGYKYNANLAQLPFITGYLWGLICAVKYKRNSRYLVAGLMAGAAVLCKYSAVLVLGPITLAVWIYFKPEFVSFTKGLLIVGLISFLLLAPHIYWSIQHQWPSIKYVHGKHAIAGQLDWFSLSIKSLRYILKFSSISCAVFALAFVLSKPMTLAETNPNYSTVKLGIIIFSLSVLGVFLGAYIEHLRLVPTWFVICMIFIGWALVDILPSNLNNDLFLLRVKQLTYGYFLIVLVIATYYKIIQINDNPHQKVLPEIFAKDLTNYYRGVYHKPISYVGGSHPLAYDVTFYSSDHPIGINKLDVNDSPWIDPAKFKLSSKVIVCPTEGYFRPAGPVCLKEAIEVFGQPTEDKIFSYNSMDEDGKTNKLVSFHALIYR